MRAYRKNLSTGNEARLIDMDSEHAPKDWTLDGRFIVFRTPRPAPRDLRVRSVELQDRWPSTRRTSRATASST
jgi:hypothetical protein